MTVTAVGFAGLGRMGAPMASNLATAGFDVTLWNRSIDKAHSLASEIGAGVVSTPRELAESCDVVISMLADDEASTAVHLGPDGVFTATTGAHHVLPMGTHDPEHVRELASRAGDRVVIDAPVSGATAAAETAQLTIMAGASESVIASVLPVLAALGKETVCLGRVGAGATMKLAVNLLIHGLNQTLAESLTLAEAAGIDPADAYRVIENSAAAAPMLHYRKALYLDEQANPVQFALSLARKDVSLAIGLGDSLGVPLPQTKTTFDQLRAAEASGFGDRDMASIVNYLREEHL
jgi:3-hydroxyisobutyrate dehydrogenase-like beta-hydroxyacid dehydrogenase